MTKKFVVVYDCGDGLSCHEFDTLEEAIEDRKIYGNPLSHPIYQRVETKVEFTLPDGTKIRKGVV